jgi:hypothetical protein
MSRKPLCSPVASASAPKTNGVTAHAGDYRAHHDGPPAEAAGEPDGGTPGDDGAHGKCGAVQAGDSPAGALFRAQQRGHGAERVHVPAEHRRHAEQRQREPVVVEPRVVEGG